MRESSPGDPATPHPRYHHDELPVDPDLDPEDPGQPSAAHHAVRHVRRGRQHLVLGAIAAGGFIGAWSRYEVGLAWRPAAGQLPWATLAINASGAFLLGVILTVLLERGHHGRLLRAFVCIGVLGAWTTMSTFALETLLLVRDGHAAVAGEYVLATVGGGLLLTWLGITAGESLSIRTARRWA